MTPSPAYKFDVFVSYAHADNKPFARAAPGDGWVTTFAYNLNNLLSRKLERDASIWMDHRELTGNGPLTPAIMDALRQTATIVVIASPRYLASDWCRREREAFLRFINQRTEAGSRVFRVEIDKVDQLPDAFRDTIGYPFWVKEWSDPTPRTLGLPVPDPSDQEYYKRLMRVGCELAEELKRRPLSEVRRQEIPASRPMPPIFLAEATDDLDSKREEVKDYLVQAGFTVLPATWRAYQDLASFQLALGKDLEQCQVFAQLLSEVPGKKPFNQPYGYPRLQYERAVLADVMILQWCSEKLRPETISDPDQRNLLEGQTVRAESIEDYKRALIAAALPKTDIAPHPAGKFVFVSADAPDRSRAEKLVGQPLIERGISYAMIPKQRDPESVRRFVEVSLANCDAALVVYCSADPASVLGQVLQCRKVIAQRDGPVPVIAIYDGPPPPRERDEISFTFPKLQFLNCRQDQTALEKFLDSLT